MKNLNERPVGKQDAPEQQADSIVAKINSTSTSNQRLAILKQLRENGPTSTFGFRAIGISSAAPRIFELKARGYAIGMNRIVETDTAGVEHQGIALYYLKPSVNSDVLK